MAYGEVQLKDLEGRTTGNKRIILPDECPTCHVGVEPKPTLGILGRNRERLQAPLICPRDDCQSVFIADYRWNESENAYELISTGPTSVRERDWPTEIRDLSQRFCTIYSHAAEAEYCKLDEIVGPGYRKALEFLVKDYAIHKNPDDEETIRSKPLAQCISDHIDSANVKKAIKIQKTAERAAWLGNDETHYERKWSNHDIKDLKTLLDLTITWVHNDLVYEDYEASIQR